MPARHIEYLRVDQIVPAATNPKRHALDGIGDSMARFGYTEPVVMDERTGRLIAGHGRIESLAARHARGEAAPEGIEVDGDGGWKLPVVRGWASSSDSAAAAALVASNKLVEAGGWDEEMLAELLGDYRDDPDWLTGTGYSDTEVVEFLARLNPDEPVALGDPDDVPEAPAEPVSRTGDIWVLGPHRAMVADCRDSDAMARLLDGSPVVAVLTDPPYGVNEKCDRGTRRRGGPFGGVGQPGPWAEAHDFPDMEGDDEPFDPAAVLALAAGGPLILFGANYYAERLPPSPSWIVWDKLDGLTTDKREVGFNDNADVELAWSNLGGPARLFAHRWTGLMKGSEHGQRRLHPTQKPVALFAWCIQRAVESAGVVLDPYAGSGTTVIAAEQTGRVARVADISASYVDTICRRWQAYTGIKPVLEATGEPYDLLTP